MAITVKHTKVSAVVDSADTSLVRPSDWNADHTLVGVGTAAALDAGVANGVATLDSAGKVPVSQMPQMGDLNYQGTWNATTNSPALVSSTGTKGYYYVVSVAGTTNLNGITDWKIGDWAVFNGTAWEKIDNTDSVTSVNGFTGAVVLGYADVGAFPATSTTGTGNVVLQTSPTINTPTLSGPTVDGTAPYVNMTPTTAPAYQEGRVFYESSSHTLAYYNDNTQMTVNIGQEQIVRVRNQTGSSIPNGTVVYVNGATGNTPTINLALATSFVTADIIGVTTTTIANNDFGYATISGLVNGLDTSAFAEGAAVFISATTAGLYTATEPVSPNYSVQVGVILRSNPSNGTLLVAVQFISTEAIHIVGSIANSQLDNSAITINGTSTSLGGSINVGTVTSVTGTAPVVSSGGATPAISMAAATSSVNGYLTSTDWSTFNNKQAAGAYLTSVTVDAPLTGAGTSASHLSMPAATGSVNGYLTSANWTTFNSKAPAVTYTANYVPYGQGTTTPAQSANLTFNGSILTVTGTGYAPNLALSDAATVAWNTATSQVATFTFIGTNRAMGAPTNLKNGAFYSLAIIQNGGSNTLTWNSVFKWSAGAAPTLSTASGAKDYFTFRSDGTNLYEQGRSLGVA